MRVVSMSEARSQLSKLVRAAADGEPFVIARSGKPLVKVVSLDAPTADARRTGFLRDISVPDDFDRMAAVEIETTFEGSR